MRNIFKIFRRDLKGVFTNFFALVVVGGLCVIPALYAWFNIYANWDPYSNTGNVNVAVVNDDKGWTDSQGTYSNMGDSVKKSLEESDSIGWIFLTSDQEAIEGLKAGKYYAALVIDEDFSNSMYNGVMEHMTNPKITYYVNDKKNAVATKITDTAASSVQRSVNKAFIEVVVQKVFTETNGIADGLQEEDVLEEFIRKIEKVNEGLLGYGTMINSFTKANEKVLSATDEANDGLKESQKKIKEGKKKLKDGQDKIKDTQTSFLTYSKSIGETLDQIEGALDSIKNQITDASLEEDAKTLTEDVTAIRQDAKGLSVKLDTLYGALEKVSKKKENPELHQTLLVIGNMKDMSDEIVTSTKGMKEQVNTAKMVQSMKSSLTSYAKLVEQLNTMYTNQVVPQVAGMMDDMSEVLVTVQNMMDSMSSTATNMSDVFDGVGTTLDTMNMSLAELKSVIDETSRSLTLVLEKLENASGEEQLDIVINFLGGNPEQLGSFFAEPVQTKDTFIYEIANYGSGVTPFYSTLAIWVGMTILVSLLKVHADKKDLDNVKLHELYLGRYMIFFILSQIQATIIVLGNLFFFKVQCLHPGLFWGAASMTSLTFSLLIYSLTISFGDIGKAVAVVIMVIQIAGSGGTFPIEALPAFFRGVYIFFPFPYAINAMRECIGGMYENDYYMYLIKLMIFCVASLMLGLVIRIPFIRLNHFFEERMEDTEML